MKEIRMYITLMETELRPFQVLCKLKPETVPKPIIYFKISRQHFS